MKKELTINEKYEIAKKALDEILSWKQISGISFIQIGRLLKLFKDERLYENLGEGSPEYETFENFIKIPSIDIQLRKAYYLIQIYEKFIEELGFKPEELSEISWTTLRLFLPVVRPENSKDLIADAKNLTRSDLEIKVAQLKSGWDAKDECQHKELSQIVYFICENCKERFKNKPQGNKIINNK